MGRTTLGVVIGNRGFFPDHLCESGRAEILRTLEEEGFDFVILGPEDTPFGSVETYQDAEKCAALFRQRRATIDGVLITLPNFGDERGAADAVRLSGLNVPVLVHAFPDEIGKLTIRDRRDSFCGKMSVCNNLRQYGIRYSLTALHTVGPASDSFRQDLRQFAGTCRIVGGLSGARIGMLGARPAAFITVRFSEKLLEKTGITIATLDLSEAFGRAGHLSDDDDNVQARLDAIKAYVSTDGVPHESLVKMAKFGVVMREWVESESLVATAVQCWTSFEEFFGIVPCTVMSMLSDSLVPSACETDVTGAIGMYAMALATGRPSALLDWNNNYGADPDKGVVFHCSNLPKAFFGDVRMDFQDIIAGTVGQQNTYGTMEGGIQSGPFTFCRVSTDDERGVVRAYVGEGELTGEPVDTFGGHGVVHIPGFQKLLRHICENGFEHHVALNLSRCGAAVNEALHRYLDWDVYYHQG